jgi:hypothetical protein
MLVPPAWLMFACVAREMAPASNVNAIESDLALKPDDTASGRLLLTPVATLHIANVSDTHSVHELPVEPDRKCKLAPTVLSPAPLNLKAPPPFKPKLCKAAPDTEVESYDTVSVNDPTASPADTITVKLPASPDQALQTTQDSDTHSVA